ncbi:hypothetical protein SEA_RENNA12_56 [Arthrobacter phage Renna12]|nr:hypothetical protein SEA_RENNA12_56 [Arthrobacter phage Renna12]
MEHWVKKAEHALRTGQPRLAELYMRRGLQESPAGRAWLARRELEAALNEYGRRIRTIVDVIIEAFRPIADALRPDLQQHYYALRPDLQQHQFTLAGPDRD